MIRTVLAGCAALALAGCAVTPDDYQFGDVSAGAYKAMRAQQQDYCATASPLLRAGLLTAIRSRVPDYPPSGLCTDADQALQAEIARRVADLPDGATVTLEQAREDQRRFQQTD